MEQHFHREMNELRKAIVELGGLVEASIGNAMTCVMTGDIEIAEHVFREEAIVDRMEVEIEEHCLKVLALYQPIAKDLRQVVATFKLINEFENMSDLAMKIALFAGDIPKSLFYDSQLNLSDMVDMVHRMVGRVLDSFLQENLELAKNIINMDEELDQIHKNNRQAIKGLVKKQKLEFIEGELALLSISGLLERIGDLVTRVAENVIYLVEGNINRHHVVENEPA